MAQMTKITIQQPEDLKRKIKQAASMSGMSVTSFINRSLSRIADKTIQQIEQRELSQRDSRALLAMLESQDEPNEALRRAAARHG